MNLLFADINRLASSQDPVVALEAFESDLHRYVAEWAPRRVFVHAGVVGWKGRAIVIPGRSFTGKSTLVAGLVRHGATYYSDEYAVLDGRGRVHPFPRALALRNNGNTKQERLSLKSLGGKTGSEPLPVGLVVVSRYRAGARWRPRRLTPGQGVLALLANAVSARRQPNRVLSSLRQAIARAPVIQGTRGEAGEVAAQLLRQLDAEQPP